MESTREIVTLLLILKVVGIISTINIHLSKSYADQFRNKFCCKEIDFFRTLNTLSDTKTCPKNYTLISNPVSFVKKDFVS